MKILKQYKDIILKRYAGGFVVREGRKKIVTSNILVALETYCQLVLKNVDKK